MRIPVAESLSKKRKQVPPHQEPQRCKVLGILWPAHAFIVNAKGPGSRIRAKAVKDIDFGTRQHPRVFIGDEVDVVQGKDRKWTAVRYYAKERCPVDNSVPTVPPVPGVVIPPEIRSEPFDFSPNILPEMTFEPPYQAGALVTPAIEQFVPPLIPGASGTYDVGGGYYGSIPAGTINHAIGLVNGAIWNKWFVTVSGAGTLTWAMYVNETLICNGSGSGSGTFTPAISFTASSRFRFSAMISGSVSNLYYGAGT